MEANSKMLATIKGLNWEELMLSPGYPSYSIDFKNSLSLAAKVLARHWIEISKDTMNKKFAPCKADMLGWSSQQISLFLDHLLEYSQSNPTSPLSLNLLEKMGDLYGFNKSKNAEICLRWQSLCLKSNADWIVDQVISFITSQGRMKFVRPLYRLFRLSDVGSELADTVFQENKSM
jgi:leukotriene-A4 hydrolase